MILASHGSLAEGMKSAAVMILGESCKIKAMGLDAFETPENILAAVRKEMDIDQEAEFLVLCDIKGGSVYNALMELCDRENVCVITGMNLSMVLELYLLPNGSDMVRAVKNVLEVSKEGIQCFSKGMLKETDDVKGDSLW